MDDLISTLTPSLIELAGAMLAFAISAAAVRFHRLTGLQIEARHREALHSAIMTAARTAVARGLTRDVATEFVAAYVKASVPDALRHLAPPAEALEGLIRSKLIGAGGH